MTTAQKILTLAQELVQLERATERREEVLSEIAFLAGSESSAEPAPAADPRQLVVPGSEPSPPAPPRKKLIDETDGWPTEADEPPGLEEACTIILGLLHRFDESFPDEGADPSRISEATGIDQGVVIDALYTLVDRGQARKVGERRWAPATAPAPTARKAPPRCTETCGTCSEPCVIYGDNGHTQHGCCPSHTEEEPETEAPPEPPAALPPAPPRSIAELLKTAGPLGLTIDELAIASGKTPKATRAKLVSLKKAGEAKIISRGRWGAP